MSPPLSFLTGHRQKVQGASQHSAGAAVLYDPTSSHLLVEQTPTLGV